MKNFRFFLSDTDKLGLTTLNVRRQRGDLIQTFKILKGIEKVDLNAQVNWHLHLLQVALLQAFEGIK
jgi:hypothetical protein